MNDLPDVQENNKPPYNIYIPVVGIENFKLPFVLNLKNSKQIQLVAETYITTDLDKDKKGISMSRLLESIKPYLNKGLCWDILKKCLDSICDLVGSKNAEIKFNFDLPIIKKSPLSNNEFPIYYPCSFTGTFVESDNYQYRFFQNVKVQYSSYCPCSAALSKDLFLKNKPHGFPHAQRSFAEINVEMDLKNKKQIWLEDIINIVIDNIKTQPYPIIKRTDEQEIAKIASENPLFVEDAIRIITHNLSQMNGIIDWSIKCIHEESIHTHDAIAINWKQ